MKDWTAEEQEAAANPVPGQVWLEPSCYLYHIKERLDDGKLAVGIGPCTYTLEQLHTIHVLPERLIVYLSEGKARLRADLGVVNEER